MTDREILHHDPPELTKRARAMRHEPSKAENALWQILRNRQVGGMKFRRQQVLGPYIVDFYCVDKHLVIEVDGDTHSGREGYDARRTTWLESQGNHVIRFTNWDVLENPDAVAERIIEVCG